jgi:DNA-binding response OmpR family regulator
MNRRACLPAASAEPILVIDDDPLHLKLVRVLLEPNGYDVTTTLNAEAGLLAAREVSPALVLVDIDLPGIDGITFVRRFRDAHRGRPVPVIVVSARTDLRTRARVLAAGADLFIPKPIDTSTFVDLVTSIVREGVVAALALQRRTPSSDRLAV